jgi:hypothetical protein
LFHNFNLFLWARKEVRPVRVCSNVLENRDLKKKTEKGEKIKIDIRKKGGGNKSTQP